MGLKVPFDASCPPWRKLARTFAWLGLRAWGGSVGLDVRMLGGLPRLSGFGGSSGCGVLGLRVQGF